MCASLLKSLIFCNSTQTFSYGEEVLRTLSQRVREVFGTSYTPTLSLKSRLSGREHGRKQTPNQNFWCDSGFALAENIDNVTAVTSSYLSYWQAAAAAAAI